MMSFKSLKEKRHYQEPQHLTPEECLYRQYFKSLNLCSWCGYAHQLCLLYFLLVQYNR